MTSFNEQTKTFFGQVFPQIYHDEVPLGQVLLYNCLKFPDKVIQICIDDGVELTCGQMSDLMKQVALRLQKLKLKFGDVVGFFARHSTFLAPAVFGCVLLGLPINPLFVNLDVEEVIKVYEETKPKLVFCDSDQVKTIVKVLESLNIKSHLVTLDGKFESFDYIKEYFESSSNIVDFDSISKTFHVTSDKVCAAIMSSSGSTGVPKLSQISHAQMLDSIYAFNGFVDNTLILNDIPPFWISGFCNLIHSILNQHAKLITAQKFTPENIVRWIEQYQPNQLGLAPSTIPSLLKHLSLKQTDLSCIKIMSTGGWSISEKVVQEMENFLVNGRLVITYGMTETAGAVARTDFSQPPTAALGELCPNVQARILLEDGTFGGIGESGEILLKIPFNFIGYLNNEAQTKALIDDDSWIHTADIGCFDENLNLFYVGRKKFMFRSHNHMVNPIEIEEIIEALPGVRKVCVVPVPDFYADGLACAVVERSPDSTITEKEIINAVSHLENHKHLKGGVVFVEELKKTSTGKLNRIAIEKDVTSVVRDGSAEQIDEIQMSRLQAIHMLLNVLSYFK